MSVAVKAPGEAGASSQRSPVQQSCVWGGGGGVTLSPSLDFFRHIAVFLFCCCNAHRAHLNTLHAGRRRRALNHRTRCFSLSSSPPTPSKHSHKNSWFTSLHRGRTTPHTHHERGPPPKQPRLPSSQPPLPPRRLCVFHPARRPMRGATWRALLPPAEDKGRNTRSCCKYILSSNNRVDTRRLETKKHALLINTYKHCSQ